MRFMEYIFLVKSDLHRYAGKVTPIFFLSSMIRNPGFKYSFWMRTCLYLRGHFFFKYSLFFLGRVILQHYEYKYGISISYKTSIGSGLYIGHFGGIVVHPMSIIGKNCNISHGVTLGQANRGIRKGYPIIGDNTYIGPGAKIVGKVRIGNNVAIGANCVVTKNIPDSAVVVGIPGKIISFQGSDEYVNNVDYG
jgi:serine O-acetyltransferase